MVEASAARYAGHPGLPDVLAAFGAVSGMSTDEQTTAVARGVLPSYFADYWGNEERLGPFREAVRATYISGPDYDLTPDVIDDRSELKGLTVPGPGLRRSRVTSGS
ncbi:hypothetical protein ACIQB5_49645 [Streptomyces sp. NPDC088560]|uniref:hypothetical protein n=1 Tax=Streptomyces sp. NPDC088560 TaxID=3365868 RepID=UPI0037F79E93